jgi:hypothetical protein
MSIASGIPRSVCEVVYSHLESAALSCSQPRARFQQNLWPGAELAWLWQTPSRLAVGEPVKSLRWQGGRIAGKLRTYGSGAFGIDRPERPVRTAATSRHRSTVVVLCPQFGFSHRGDIKLNPNDRLRVKYSSVSSYLPDIVVRDQPGDVVERLYCADGSLQRIGSRNAKISRCACR